MRSSHRIKPVLFINNKDSETLSLLYKSKPIPSSLFLSSTNLIQIQLHLAGPSPAFAFTAGSRSASYSIEYEEYYDNSDEEDDEEYESGDYDNENNSE